MKRKIKRAIYNLIVKIEQRQKEKLDEKRRIYHVNLSKNFQEQYGQNVHKVYKVYKCKSPCGYQSTYKDFKKT